MGITHKIGPFKFERSGGIFGGGDKVKVYKSGKEIDEFYLDDDTVYSIKLFRGNAGAQQNAFAIDCEKWFGKYGISLLGED